MITIGRLRAALMTGELICQKLGGNGALQTLLAELGDIGLELLLRIEADENRGGRRTRLTWRSQLPPDLRERYLEAHRRAVSATR